MADRYFSEAPITTNAATLDGPEAHHLIHVMRAKPGVEVTLFDGSGAEFPATVQRVSRSEVQLSVGPRREVDRELPFLLSLAVALPKGDRQKWLVEKAVELGVGRIVPLETERGVAQPVEQTLVRLRRGVIEASKQCGRNRLMEITEPRAWAELAMHSTDAACRLLAHPGACTGCRDQAAPLGDSGAVIAAIGPEGGFTEDEACLGLSSGWRGIDLGRRILRVETAALALAAMIAAARCEM